MFSLFRAIWRGERGAFDLSSIMTGIVVTGILGAVTATTFLAVIPWFQDKTAKDDLQLIQIAEDSHYTDRGAYGDMAALTSNRYLHQISSKQACVDKTTVANTYTAYVTSSSGKVFRFNYATSELVIVTTPIPANCK